MTCPKCGSNQVSVNLRSAGTRSHTNYYRHGVKNSWIMPAGRRSYRSDRKHKAVCLCQNCGHVWDAKNQEKGFAYYFLCVILFPLSLSLLFYDTEKIQLDRKWRVLILAVVWAVIIIALSLYGQAHPRSV